MYWGRYPLLSREAATALMSPQGLGYRVALKAVSSTLTRNPNFLVTQRSVVPQPWS